MVLNVVTICLLVIIIPIENWRFFLHLSSIDGLFYDKSRDKANDRGPLFPREDTKNKDQIFHFAGGEDIMSLMVELSSPRRRENINERAIKCVVVVAAELLTIILKTVHLLALLVCCVYIHFIVGLSWLTLRLSSCLPIQRGDQWRILTAIVPTWKWHASHSSSSQEISIMTFFFFNFSLINL